MPEYIEREAFIKRLEHEADRSSGIIDLLILNGIANILRDEKIAPTADVEEVRHGKWEEEYPGSDNIVCPACGKLWNVLDNCTEEFDRCPKCGCVMEGKKEGAEVERLKDLKNFERFTDTEKEAFREQIGKLFDVVRVEAVKEFAEVVACDIDNYCEKNIKTKPFVDGVTGMQIAHNLVYKRLKEMVGDEK